MVHQPAVGACGIHAPWKPNGPRPPAPGPVFVVPPGLWCRPLASRLGMPLVTLDAERRARAQHNGSGPPIRAESIWAVSAAPTVNDRPAPIRRSARFGIHVGRIVAYVWSRPCVQRYTRPTTRPPHLGSRPRPGPGLSFGLIHPRPPPFTDVHSDRVRAVGGRRRTPVNAVQQCWQPLRSSNLLSSAT
jgi:hypothetical protein